MRKLFILICGFIAATGLQAQEGSFKTYSLKEAVQYGIQNNISAKNAKLSEEQTRAHNHELLSIGLPQINGNFDYTYYILRPTSPAFESGFNFSSLPPQYASLASLFPSQFYVALHNNINTGVNLSQMIYDTRFFIGIQTFKELVKTSRLQTALTEQDIRYNIIKGYSQVQAAKEIIRSLDSNLVIIDKLLNDTRETYKQGLIEETDVDRLQLGESTLKSQINNTKNQYDLAMASLKYNMGLKLSDQIALTDDIESLRQQLNISNPSFDPSQRIENNLLQTAVVLHDYDRKRRKAGYYPSINGLANLGAGAQADKFDNMFHVNSNYWFSQSYVGFSIKVPIYDGGMTAATAKEAKIDVLKAKNDLENFQTQSTLQVDAAKTTFFTNLSEEQNAKESMQLNNKIFAKTSVKFKEGVGSSFELMQTQQDMTQNQIRYYTAVMNVLTSRADLDKALGIQ